MKTFYLIGSIFFTVLILIIGFQNFASTFSGFTVFFADLEALNSTLIVFGLSFLGSVTGAFYIGYLMAVLKQRQEDEEQPGGMA